MKLFQINRKNMELLGIHPPGPNFKNKFNIRNLGCLFCLGLWNLSSALFMVFNTNTFRDYASCFHTCIAMLNFSLAFFVLILKSEYIFPLYEKLENTIENRTFNSIAHSLENNYEK